MTVTPNELNQELLRLSRRLDAAHADLVKAVREYAEREHAYRLARSSAFLTAEGTIADKESKVDQSCGDLRKERDIAEGMKVSALELVRSLRSQLSALQTVSSSVKAEAELARVGPN